MASLYLKTLNNSRLTNPVFCLYFLLFSFIFGFSKISHVRLSWSRAQREFNWAWSACVNQCVARSVWSSIGRLFKRQSRARYRSAHLWGEWKCLRRKFFILVGFPSLYREYLGRGLLYTKGSASSSGASFLAWHRRARNASDWWWTARLAHTFSERRLGTRQFKDNMPESCQLSKQSIVQCWMGHL